MNDRASRAIHQAQAQRIQSYMQQRHPTTASPQTMRRPDGIDMSVQAYARDARRQVANRHRDHNRAQSRNAARTGGQSRAAARVQQQRQQARQSTRAMQRER